jgi:hypothetical protein
MDFKTATIAMRKYFNDNFTTCAIAIPDMVAEFTDVPWVRFNILHANGYQATMGSPASNRFERIGLITVQIFVPQGDNSVTATNIATEILKLYEGVEDSGILYSNAYAKEVGNDGRGWYQINVLTEFKYSEIT